MKSTKKLSETILIWIAGITIGVLLAFGLAGLAQADTESEWGMFTIVSDTNGNLGYFSTGEHQMFRSEAACNAVIEEAHEGLRNWLLTQHGVVVDQIDTACMTRKDLDASIRAIAGPDPK